MKKMMGHKSNSGDKIIAEEKATINSSEGFVMFCKYCGKKISSESEFCPYCGKKMNIPREEKKTTLSVSTNGKANDIKANNNNAGKSKKKLFIIIPILVVLLIGGAVIGISANAYRMADAGDFDAAKKYSSLIFWDSTFKDYVEYGVKMNGGEYSSAINGFNRLGDYRASKELYKECKYLDGVKKYEGKNYFDAYDIFLELKDYKDSNSYLEKIRDDAHNAAVSAFTNGSFSTAKGLFELAGESDNNYIKVINVLEGNSPITALKGILNFSPAKEVLLKDDDLGSDFLNGNWTSGDGYYYFDTTKESNGNYTIEWNVPFFDYGDYIMIDNGTIYAYPDNNLSAKRALFDISVKDWNTICIKCMEDGYTYTLYRD